MPLFLSRLRQDALLVPEALAKKDFGFVASFAHKLRGNGPSYEIHELGYLGSELEKLAKAGNIAECKSSFEKIKDYIDRMEIIYVGGK